MLAFGCLDAIVRLGEPARVFTLCIGTIDCISREDGVVLFYEFLPDKEAMQQVTSLWPSVAPQLTVRLLGSKAAVIC
jgi:hypothetical protein